MIKWVSEGVNEWVSEEGSEWIVLFVIHHLSFIIHQFVILSLSFVILPSSFTWWTTSFYFIESYIRLIRTVHRTGHDWRSAIVVRIRNVNTVLLNGNIVIFKSLLNFIFWMASPFFIIIWWRLFNYYLDRLLLLIIN